MDNVVDVDDNDKTDAFKAAIDNRFGANSSGLLTARLATVSLPTTTATTTPTKTTTTTTMMTTTSSSPASSFIAVAPQALSEWLNRQDTLVVDIRPHAAYTSARLPHALSLSVPSTLLKRPLFSLDRLTAMLPSAAARARFTAWRSAARILVYDADSSAIPDSSNIHGLLRKFRNDAFPGQLAWLQGGFQSVWRDQRQFVDTGPPSPEPDTEDDDLDNSTSLRTAHLPPAAFTAASTSFSSHKPKRSHPGISLSAMDPPPVRPAFNPFFDTVRQNVELSHGITERIPLRLPRRVRRRINDLPFRWLQDIVRRADGFISPSPSSRDPVDSSDSDGDIPILSTPFPHPDPADVEEGTEALAMQFYRIELAEQRRLMGVMEHHSKESGSILAQLNKTPLQEDMFPFSITAGVEKGTKNRYRHIWPFEHARVRLHARYRRIPATSSLAASPSRAVELASETQDPHAYVPGSLQANHSPHVPPNPHVASHSDTDSGEWDDYVNASYVQPLCTTRRYIATQGPLPATFVDFWTLVWEQNVHVIVMLTRQIEGSMVKCGSYWTDERFGPLRLRMLQESGREPTDAVPGMNPFEAAMASQQATTGVDNAQSMTIRRVFELSHTRFPAAGTRRIVQLQYLGWPDMNVPEDPRGILDLVWEVQGAVEETQSTSNPSPAPAYADETVETHTSTSSDEEVDERTGIAKHALGDHAPVLLHCSAGVGRTGGFIAVDAILDGLRREMRQRVYNVGDDLVTAKVAFKAALPHAAGSDSGNRTDSRSLSPRMGSGSGGLSVGGSGSGLVATGSGGELADASGSGSRSGSGSQGSGMNNTHDNGAGTDATDDKMDVDVHMAGGADEAVARTIDDHPGSGLLSIDFGATVGHDVAGSKVGGTVPITMTSGDAFEVSGSTSASQSPGNGSDRNDEEEPAKEKRRGKGKGKESKAGGHGHGHGGLVVHVPFVLGAGDDVHRTPMQMAMDVDDEDDGKVTTTRVNREEEVLEHGQGFVKTKGKGKDTTTDTLTRRWAETVHDETGAAEGVVLLMEGQGGNGSGFGSGSGSGSNSNEQSPSPMVGPAGASEVMTSVTKLKLEAAAAPHASTASLTTSSSSEDSFGFRRVIQHRRHDQPDSSAAPPSSPIATSVNSGSASENSSSVEKEMKGRNFKESGLTMTGAVMNSSLLVAKDIDQSRARTLSAPTGHVRLPPPKLDLSAFTRSPTAVMHARPTTSVAGIATGSAVPIPTERQQHSTVTGAPTSDVSLTGFMFLAPTVETTSSSGEHGNSRSSVNLEKSTWLDEVRSSKLANPLAPVMIPGASAAKGNSVASTLASTASLFAGHGNISGGPRPHRMNGPNTHAPGHALPMGTGQAPAQSMSSYGLLSYVQSQTTYRPPPAIEPSSRIASGLSSEDESPPASRASSLPIASHSTELAEGLGTVHSGGRERQALSSEGSRSHQEAALEASDARSANVDYKEPRPLHGDASPPPLSGYEDPIYEVVQDMREQRMSLCQSLRQYVFVHAAIVEGALMVVDEERERAKAVMAARTGSTSRHSSFPSARTEEDGMADVQPSLPRTPPPVVRPTITLRLSSGSSPSTGKRGASPTELPKEDKKGAISLSKRPSIKRKPASSDGSLGSS